MFSLPGLPKLLILFVLLVAAWLLLRRHWSRRAPSRRAKASPGTRSAKSVEDMKPCKVCGAFVAAGAGACGRPDCPY